VVLSNSTLLSNKSGSIKERTQTTTWQQPISLSSAAGQCARKDCALNRKLANRKAINILLICANVPLRNYSLPPSLTNTWSLIAMVHWTEMREKWKTCLPGLSNAGSTKSGRLVAPTTNTSVDLLSPSISANSCDTTLYTHHHVTPPCT